MRLFSSRLSRLDTLVASAEDLLDSIGDVANPQVRALKRELRSSLPVLKDHVRDYARRGAGTARAAGGFAVARARRYPWLTLLVGAAIAVYALNSSLGDQRD